jgi:hypothetical protein
MQPDDLAGNGETHDEFTSKAIRDAHRNLVAGFQVDARHDVVCDLRDKNRGSPFAIHYWPAYSAGSGDAAQSPVFPLLTLSS